MRKRTVETLDELTPQEAQVAASPPTANEPGIGAQLFLSPRTVEWHLTKVFGKLGISSRRELRSALSDVGQPSSASSSDGGPGDGENATGATVSHLARSRSMPVQKPSRRRTSRL